MKMPSDTVMVLKSTLLPPAASIPAHASRASSPMCMLHGVRLPQVEATPICGLPKSSSPNPTARNMARAGACISPSTTTRECRRGSTSFFFISTPCQGNVHAAEAQRSGGRHDQRQEQRKLSGTLAPSLEGHVDHHARGRGEGAT